MAPTPETRLISGSEVKAFQECQMQWWFKFRLGIAPKKLSDALFIGTVGHIALSDMYTEFALGGSVEAAVNKMRLRLSKEMEKNNHHMTTGFINPMIASGRMGLITQVMNLLEEYIEYYAKSDSEKFEVVEVEHMHVSGKFSVMRLDLLMRNLETGKLELWDHKFVSSFYTEKLLRVNSQLPLYMKVVIGSREEEVAYGVLNQLKKKQTKEEIEKGLSRFRRDEVPYKEIAVKKRTEDQQKVTDQIRPFYGMKLMEAKDKVVRTLNDNTCKFCLFYDPCMTDLDGKTSEMRALVSANFERSTYGYNH
jgi:hypothetical protein